MQLKKIVVCVCRILLRGMYILPIKKNRIFLTSFDGTSIGYDSRSVLEYIIKNYPNKYELIWGCKDKIDLVNNYPELKCVKIKSLQGVIAMMTSHVLIYNINAPTYIPFRDKQILFNTWHGYPLKKIGKDANDFYDVKQVNTSTYYLSHSVIYNNFLRDAFGFQGKILECGLPRNDVLVNWNNGDKKCSEIKHKLGLEAHVNLVLYAPTFRGDFEYHDAGLNYKILLKSLKRRFGGNWKLLFRLHPRTSNIKINELSDDIKDVSRYPDMQDLLYAADILITDYSSSMWDFSLTKKPVFLYASDINAYKKSRGLYDYYFKLPFLLAETNEKLISNILDFDQKTYTTKVNEFHKNQGSFEKGCACATILKIIQSAEYY